MTTSPRIMVIAGEISGDMHAANLVAALQARVPGATFFGIGGDRLRKLGVEISYDVKDMAVMGFVEVMKRFFFFRRAFNDTVRLAAERKPDVAILVDYPGFNLRLAEKLHKMNIRVVYYICPQVWAWNQGRIPEMAEKVDRLITIFPFEAKYFAGTKLRVDFVGHPLVDEIAGMSKEPASQTWHGTPRVAILPGSRRHVIHYMLPTMWQAAKLIEKKHPDVEFILASPSVQVENILSASLRELGGGPARWKIVTGRTREILRSATAAMVVSGTSTLEASLMLCPMLVAYKMNPLTYQISKRLVKIDHIGMVNIVAGRRICPELVQNAATPEAIAETLEPLLTEGPARTGMIDSLRRVNFALGLGGAAGRAADIVMQELQQPPA